MIYYSAGHHCLGLDDRDILIDIKFRIILWRRDLTAWGSLVDSGLPSAQPSISIHYHRTYRDYQNVLWTLSERRYPHLSTKCLISIKFRSTGPPFLISQCRALAGSGGLSEQKLHGANSLVYYTWRLGGLLRQVASCRTASSRLPNLH